MRIGIALGYVVLTSVLAGARADTTGSGGGFQGSGVLTVKSTGDANGSYLITGMTGDYVDYLLPVNAFHGNQNLVYPNSTPTLDASGFSFVITQYNTDSDVNLFASGPNSYEANILDFQDDDQHPQTIGVTFDLGTPVTSSFHSFATALPEGDSYTIPFSFEESSSVTPEPGTVALLGTGLMGLAGVLRRRHRVRKG